MSLHMIRVICEPPKGNAEQAIQNWVENYQEWQNDPVEHTLTETNTRFDGSGVQYLRGDWRFIQQGETPTGILQDLSDRLKSFQGGLYHRLGYHVCTHSEDNPQSCSWDEKVEYGDIPSGLPDFEVN